MTDITDRLERLYTDHGTNYVQEAAREIRNLRAEVAGLRSTLADSHAYVERLKQRIDELLAARKGEA